MTPRTVLALAALAVTFSSSWIPAQSNQADRLRESKLETYLARAQTALGRLEDELGEEHLDGARVAAAELRQALAALEKTRRSGSQTPADSFQQLLFNRASSRPTKAKTNAGLFNPLLQGKATSRPSGNSNPFEQIQRLHQQQKADPNARTEGPFDSPPEPAEAPNLMERVLQLQMQGEKADLKKSQRRLNELLQNSQDPPAAPEPEKAKRKPHDIMAADPPASYRELQLNGQTVIVPEELLGGSGEVTQQGSQLVIRKADK